MVTFDSRQSYDDAVNAKCAKLRGRDWMKTVSVLTETVTSANHLSAKVLEVQSAMLVARFDVTPWYNNV